MPSARERLERREPLGRQRIRGQAVGDDADLMPAPRQLLGQVADVAEQAADRRPQDLEDAERSIAGHGLRASARR